MERIFDPLFLASLIIVITIHEFSHALTADFFGDPTARLRGRLTLNPLAHLDPIGSLVFIASALTGYAFGWAKPVPIDTYNLRNPQKESMLIALAGPASNILTAIICGLLIRMLFTINLGFGLSAYLSFLYQIATFSVSLAVFNLLPIAPLDGSKILFGLLPAKQAITVEQFLNKYGFFILLYLILSNSLSMIIVPPIRLLLGLILPSPAFFFN